VESSTLAAAVEAESDTQVVSYRETGLSASRRERLEVDMTADLGAVQSSTSPPGDVKLSGVPFAANRRSNWQQSPFQG